MRRPGYFVIAFSLAGCASSSGGGANSMNPASAKADNSAFMSGLSAPSRQFAAYCQSELQRKLGGMVYIVASPSLQSNGGSATAEGSGPSGSTQVVYDQVKDGKTTTGSSTCTPPASAAGGADSQ